MHQSVLSKELINFLDIKEEDTVIDCTLNGGGHAQMVCERLGEKGRFVGIDLDEDAIEKARTKIEKSECNIKLVNDNFRNIKKILGGLEMNSIEKIYLDLGLSSNQLENSNRGFAYQNDEPLIMTFKKNPDEKTLTAEEIVNNWEEENIADIIYGFGEERSSRRIAKAITEARKENPIKTTNQLVEIIENASPKIPHLRKIHPARKTFQALRIAVNDELNALRDFLEDVINYINEDGIIAIISFHGLEDRIVKRKFKEWRNLDKGEVLTKKPITPNEEEVNENKRSRSAKLRVFKKNNL